MVRRSITTLLMAAVLIAAMACSSGSSESDSTAKAASPTADVAQKTISVTDIVGRQVSLKAPVKTMILSEARVIYIMAPLLPEDPFKGIVGWADDLRANDFDTYNKYKEKFPQLTDIPVYGNMAQGAFSVEKAITAKPDVVVMTYDSYVGARANGILEKLSAVGIPAVVVDFRNQALENTLPSIQLLGRITGTEDRAQALQDYYTTQMNMVYSRVEAAQAKTKTRPSVFLYRAAGLADCCGTFGNGNMGMFIDRVGGTNIGSKFLPIWQGTMSPEQVIASDPDVIIVTGSNWTNAKPPGNFAQLGYGTTAAAAKDSLQKVVDSTAGWKGLKAVQDKRVYSIWHQFYISPYHFITMTEFAKWLYPEAFADVDTDAMFKDFHEKFLPITYTGTFWTGLN